MFEAWLLSIVLNHRVGLLYLSGLVLVLSVGLGKYIFFNRLSGSKRPEIRVHIRATRSASKTVQGTQLPNRRGIEAVGAFFPRVAAATQFGGSWTAELESARTSEKALITKFTICEPDSPWRDHGQAEARYGR